MELYQGLSMTLISKLYIYTPDDDFYGHLEKALRSFILEDNVLERISDKATLNELPKNFRDMIILAELSLEELKVLAQHYTDAIVVGLGSAFDVQDELTVFPKIIDAAYWKSNIYQVVRYAELHRELVHTEEMTTLFADYALEVIWSWNLTDNLLTFNKEGWQKTFGLSEANDVISYDDWMSRVHPDDVKKVHQYFKRIIENKRIKQFSIQYRMLGKEGYVYLHESGNIHRDNNGIAYKVTGATGNISEKKAYDAELNRLSAIIKQSNSGVIITDKQGLITWVNDAFTNITGYTSDEVIGLKPGTVLQGAETDPATIKMMSQHFEKNIPFDCEVLNYSKSGEKIWIRLYCQPNFSTDGKPDGYFAIQHNITAEKIIDAQMAISEIRLKTLLQKTSDGLSIVSADGNTVNQLNGNNILGYEELAYTKDFYHSYIHPDDILMMQETFSRVRDVPESIEAVEFRAKRVTGEYIWMECSFRNLLNDPIVKGIVCNYRDINERKVSETLIKTSESKYRKLFSNNPLALFVWNPNTLQIIESNETVSIMYGYSTEELRNITIRELIVPEKHERFDYYVEKMRKGEFVSNDYQSINVKKNGELMYVYVTFTPFDIDGEAVYLTMINDMTEQIKLEQQLAEEQMKRQQEITSAVIIAQEQEKQHIGRELHDNINQILATSRLYIEYANSTTDDEKRQQLLITARSMVLTAVNEIRNLSSNLMASSLEEVGLKVSLDEIVQSLEKVNPFRIIKEWNFDEERVPVQLKLTIYRIIQEQLNNIIKHAQATEVHLSVKAEKDCMVVRVKDNGIGFNEKQVQKGLGLKNIKSRAALHNGSTQITSAPGKGTEMVIMFQPYT